MGVAKRQRTIDVLTVNGEAGSLPDPDIVPRRFRVPLLGEIDPVGGRSNGGFEDQTRCLLYILGKLPSDRVGDVDLTPLQCRYPGGLIGNDPEDEALDAGSLSPKLIECFKNQLDTRRK